MLHQWFQIIDDQHVQLHWQSLPQTKKTIIDANNIFITSSSIAWNKWKNVWETQDQGTHRPQHGKTNFTNDHHSSIWNLYLWNSFEHWRVGMRQRWRLWDCISSMIGQMQRDLDASCNFLHKIQNNLSIILCKERMDRQHDKKNQPLCTNLASFCPI